MNLGDAAILFVAGIVAGTINVIAGGGSFLTLPILIFMGLPVPVANGTNRISIFIQNIGAVWGFGRHKVIPWRFALRASAVAAVGAGFGATAVFWVDDATFKRLLAFLMVAVTLWTLVGKGGKGAAEATNDGKGLPLWAEMVGFFCVGIYGGFVQAGVGFFLLAMLTMSGYDMVRGNAVKVVCVLAFSLVAIVIFISKGAVNWPLGLSLAAGSLIGSQIGVKLTVTKGHRWVKSVVTVMVIVFAIKLLVG